MREVATLAGVSLATVSRVINDEGSVRGRPAPSACRRRSRLLGYRRDLTATNLRRADRESASIGLVFDDVANPFHAAVLRGVETVARDARGAAARRQLGRGRRCASASWPRRSSRAGSTA